MKKTSFIKSLALLQVMLFLLLGNVKAQNNFIQHNLGPGINTEYAEINPVISLDGKILFFNRINHPENSYGSHESQDIWYSYLQADGSWGSAKRLDVPFNKARYNAILCPVNQITYLIDGVYTKGKNPKWRKRGISLVTRSESDLWGNPKELKIKGFSRINKGESHNIWMSGDGNVLIFSYHKQHKGKNNHLYVSLNRNGKWGKPKPLSEVINIPNASKEAPFISYDMETMYFSSNFQGKNKREKSYNFNIYKTTRLDDSWRMWATPVLLSDTLNSGEWDSYFRTNKKGNWAIFSSSKYAAGQADIYMVKLFEENPFVDIAGTLINKTQNTPLGKGKNFTILVDGEALDTSRVTVNTDSSTFKLRLPLGKKYTLQATAKNFTSSKEEVNTEGLREYLSIKKDLFGESFPFVRLTGRILVENSGEIISNTANANISINGKTIDTLKINYPNGTFAINLPFGKSYTISANALKYNSVPVKIDLSKVEEYKKLEQDLYVKSTPTLTVKGRFYLQGTKNPIPGKAMPKLLVNSLISDSAIIDTTESSYKVVLPMKKEYQISFVANRYLSEGIVRLVINSTTKSIDTTINLYGSFVSTTTVIAGKVMNRKTNQPLVGNKVAIQLNGENYSMANFDPNTGEYQLEASLGSQYTLNASLEKYLPQYENIDLTKVKTSTKIIKDLYLTPLEVGQKVKMNNIFFETGKSTLKPNSFEELNKIASFLIENNEVKIQIEGHTDNVGKPDANLKLSKWRARAVQLFLTNKGISADRVKFEGFGANKPVAKNNTPQGRSQNRRVEFNILAVD